MNATKIAETATIPQLAKQAGLQPRTLFRRLMALQNKYGGDWMYRGRRKIRVNVAALRAAHPAVFDPPDLLSRVSDLEDRVTKSERDIVGVATSLGRLRAELTG